MLFLQKNHPLYADVLSSIKHFSPLPMKFDILTAFLTLELALLPEHLSVDQKASVDHWRAKVFLVIHETIQFASSAPTGAAFDAFVQSEQPKFAFSDQHGLEKTRVLTASHQHAKPHTLENSIAELSRLLDGIERAFEASDNVDDQIYRLAMLLTCFAKRSFRHLDKVHRKYAWRSDVDYKMLIPFYSLVHPVLYRIEAITNLQLKREHTPQQHKWLQEIEAAFEEQALCGAKAFILATAPKASSDPARHHVDASALACSRVSQAGTDTSSRVTFTHAEVANDLQLATLAMRRLFRFLSWALPFWRHLDCCFECLCQAVDGALHSDIYSEEVRKVLSLMDQCCSSMDQLLKLSPHHWPSVELVKIHDWVLHTRHAIHQAQEAIKEDHYAHLANLLPA